MLRMQYVYKNRVYKNTSMFDIQHVWYMLRALYCIVMESDVITGELTPYL